MACFHQIPPFGTQGIPQKRTQRECQNQGEWGHQKNQPSTSTWARLIGSHRDWTSMQSVCLSQLQHHSIYIMVPRLVIYGIPECKWVNFWFFLFCFLLDTFPSLDLSCPKPIWRFLVLPYILFCYTLIFLLEIDSFLIRDRNRMDPDRTGYGKELGRVERGEIIIIIQYMSKEFFFNQSKMGEARYYVCSWSIKMFYVANLACSKYILLVINFCL